MARSGIQRPGAARPESWSGAGNTRRSPHWADRECTARMWCGCKCLRRHYAARRKHVLVVLSPYESKPGPGRTPNLSYIRGLIAACCSQHAPARPASQWSMPWRSARPVSTLAFLGELDIFQTVQNEVSIIRHRDAVRNDRGGRRDCPVAASAARRSRDFLEREFFSKG